MKEVDQREARQVLWLKYATQTSHYEAFEKFCVEYGFARLSETDGEKQQGNLVFFDPSRIIQPDEFSFNFNGADERAGGRPSHPYSFDGVKETGQAIHKSSDKCTVLQAVTFGDEALPPFVIFPTKATIGTKIYPKTVAGFKQVRGKYGLNDYFCHDAIIALSSNVPMTNILWSHWVTERLMDLYPDAQDTPGLRVLIKADSGPGES